MKKFLVCLLSILFALVLTACFVQISEILEAGKSDNNSDARHSTETELQNHTKIFEVLEAGEFDSNSEAKHSVEVELKNSIYQKSDIEKINL